MGPSRGIQPLESSIEPIEILIRQLSKPAERMTHRDPLPDRDAGEQGPAELPMASAQQRALPGTMRLLLVCIA
jgi:hypothetical protein